MKQYDQWVQAGRMWKEAAIVPFKEVSWQQLGTTEKNVKHFGEDGQPVCQAITHCVIQ